MFIRLCLFSLVGLAHQCWYLERVKDDSLIGGGQCGRLWYMAFLLALATELTLSLDGYNAGFAYQITPVQTLQWQYLYLLHKEIMDQGFNEIPFKQRYRRTVTAMFDGFRLRLRQ